MIVLMVWDTGWVLLGMFVHGLLELKHSFKSIHLTSKRSDQPGGSMMQNSIALLACKEIGTQSWKERRTFFHKTRTFDAHSKCLINTTYIVLLILQDLMDPVEKHACKYCRRTCVWVGHGFIAIISIWASEDAMVVLDRAAALWTFNSFFYSWDGHQRFQVRAWSSAY